jgi:hypothetical protein
MHHQSMEYRKTEQHLEVNDSESSKSGMSPISKQVSMGPSYAYGAASQVRPQNMPADPYSINQYTGLPFQMSMQFPPYPNMAYTQPENYYANNSYQIESAIRKERDRVKILEQEL